MKATQTKFVLERLTSPLLVFFLLEAATQVCKPLMIDSEMLLIQFRYSEINTVFLLCLGIWQHCCHSQPVWLKVSAACLPRAAGDQQSQSSTHVEEN